MIKWNPNEITYKPSLYDSRDTELYQSSGSTVTTPSVAMTDIGVTLQTDDNSAQLFNEPAFNAV